MKRCENCKLCKSGNCGGVGDANTCISYEGLPTITYYERSLWPKYGMATAIRKGEANDNYWRNGVNNEYN